MRIVFRIGMGKTGTTSIQHALRNGTGALANQRAAYLSMWFEEIDPAFEGLGGFARFIAGNEQEKVAAADSLHSYMVDRAAKEDIETFVFSNEGVFAAGPQLDPFFRRLKAKGLSMSFVVYLRDPRAWLPSAYTQWAIQHKTNRGPVQDFPSAARRLIGQYEGMRFWIQNFGDVLTVRPFESGVDVVDDFAQTVGLDLPKSEIETLERAEPADILLRAMFNTRFPDQVMPDRFDRFVTNSSQVTVPSLREMAVRCLRHEGAEDIIAEKRELFEFIRDTIGFDFLDGNSKPSKMPDEEELQRRVIDYLVEVTLDQAQRLQRLERCVEEFLEAGKQRERCFFK
jgi:hypothetical protein